MKKTYTEMYKWIACQHPYWSPEQVGKFLNDAIMEGLKKGELVLCQDPVTKELRLQLPQQS